MNVHGILFLVSLFYAILFSWAGEIMPKYLSSETLVWIRITFATLAFHSVSWFTSKESINWKKHAKELAICAFFGTSANMFLFFKGLESTYPINGAILMLATPIFVAIFDHIRLKSWPKWGFALSLFIAAFACYKLLTFHNHEFTKKTMLGDLWVAINAIFYAVYLVRIKKLTAIYKPITLNKWTFTLGWLYVTPISIYSVVHTPYTLIPSLIWWKISYILVFTSFLVYLMNAYAVKQAGPTLAGLYIYLQPLLATLIAFVFATDQISFLKIVYILIVLAATFYATRNSPVAKNDVASPS
jgi:drug/metabolite transporter (DMT)-like permease